MKNTMKRIVDASIVRLSGYVLRRMRENGWIISQHLSVVQEMERRAACDTADYVVSDMSQAICLQDIYELRRHAFAARPVSGLIVEFGVWTGSTIRSFSSLTGETVYGFDSFEGLRDDWYENPKGSFSLDGVPPSVPPNVKLVQGWFDETLPAFVRENRECFSFVHIDSDTYEAASCIFRLAAIGSSQGPLYYSVNISGIATGGTGSSRRGKSSWPKRTRI